MKRDEIIAGLRRAAALVGASARDACVSACVEIEALAQAADEYGREAKQAWAEAKGYRDAIDTEIDRRQYVEAELRDAFALLIDMRDSMYVRPYRARIDAFMERYAKGDTKDA